MLICVYVTFDFFIPSSDLKKNQQQKFRKIKLKVTYKEPYNFFLGIDIGVERLHCSVYTRLCFFLHW